MAKNQKTPRTARKPKEQDVYMFYIPAKEVPTTKKVANSQSTRVATYDCVDDVLIDGSVRRIKYVKGEKTIFEDEMSEQNKKKAPESVRFVDGWLYVRKEEATLLKYMLLTDNNMSKEDRQPGKNKIFKQHAPERDVKILNDLEKNTIKAKAFVMEQMETEEGMNELLTYAKALGINTNRDINLVEYDINQYINRDAKGFMDGLNNPKMKRKFTVLSAIENNIIKMVGTSVTWVENGGTIVVTPMGIDPVDYLVDWSFGNQETYDLIKQKLLQGEPVE